MPMPMVARCGAQLTCDDWSGVERGGIGGMRCSWDERDETEWGSCGRRRNDETGSEQDARDGVELDGRCLR